MACSLIRNCRRAAGGHNTHHLMLQLVVHFVEIIHLLLKTDQVVQHQMNYFDMPASTVQYLKQGSDKKVCDSNLIQHVITFKYCNNTVR